MDLSLPSLLWHALGDLERAHTLCGAGRGSLPSLERWANALRVLDEGGTARQTLPTSLRLSKRAVRSRIAAAIREGWVEDRGELVRLTERGSQAGRGWEQLSSAAEQGWQAQVGASTFRATRESLEAVVTQFPLEHPHYPASYGPADATITGGNGRDWSPVERHADTALSDLPLSALFSQALVAFAMAYEIEAGVALSLSASVLVRMPPEGRPAKGLERSVGLAALERHGYLSQEDGNGRSGSLVRLTAKGRRVSDAYAGRVEAVEDEWNSLYGRDVRSLRAALEAIRS